MQANTNNVNKKRALLQTIGGKDEPNIAFMNNVWRGNGTFKSKIAKNKLSYFPLCVNLTSHFPQI